jgi:hypothetical protein
VREGAAKGIDAGTPTMRLREVNGDQLVSLVRGAQHQIAAAVGIEYLATKRSRLGVVANHGEVLEHLFRFGIQVSRL